MFTFFFKNCTKLPVVIGAGVALKYYLTLPNSLLENDSELPDGYVRIRVYGNKYQPVGRGSQYYYYWLQLGRGW